MDGWIGWDGWDGMSAGCDGAVLSKIQVPCCKDMYRTYR